MLCCSKRAQNYEKRFKNNKISPEEIYRPPTSHRKVRKTKKIIKEQNKIMKEKNEEFHNNFINEIISCGYCQKKFTIGSNELKINCGKCNKFYHCYIAGKCQCNDCTIIINGKIENLSYCLNCANTVNCKDGYCKCIKSN